MKKLILAFVLLLILGSIVVSVHASILSNFTLNNVPDNSSEYWKLQQFDRLVLDAVIPANSGNTDFLQGLAVMNLSTARNGKEIEKLTLWTDGKAPGFQGMGIDNKIGDANWDADSATWYWKDLAPTIPPAGLRIFISIETRKNMDESRSIQIIIPKLVDNNNNGQFDIGDKGVFTYYANNGPRDNELVNAGVQSIRFDSSDREGPKSAVTNLFEGDKVMKGENFTVSGLSRDQGKYSVKSMEISIVKTGAVDNWTSVATDKYDFINWQYVWKPAEAGEYKIKLRSRDLLENESITDSLTVSAVDSLARVSKEKSHLTVDLLTAKADGKIYVNAVVEARDAAGNPLEGKNAELSYYRSMDNYVARNVQTTGASGVLVWGAPAKIAAEVIFTAIVDGVELAEHPKVTFTE